MRRRINKKKNYTGGVILLLLCAFIAIWGAFSLFSGEQQAKTPLDYLTKLEPAPSHTEDHKIAPQYEVTPQIPIKEYQIAQSLSINSSNAILTRVENGDVLFEKKSTAKIYPASMTKIMTAILVLENLNDIKENIVLNEKIFSAIYETNASVAGFVAGEKVRAIDLLYGLMLPSGAECAIGLADRVAGSENAFVDLMNNKARELGMNDTHFTNTIGLHDANHYSTVKDISTLLQYAVENDAFYEIFTTARHSTPSTNKHEGGITYYSTLFSKIDSADFDGGSILGGKTGYTGEAGQCLASLAVKDGERFILVTGGAPGDNRTQSLHIDDAFVVYSAITIAD